MQPPVSAEPSKALNAAGGWSARDWKILAAFLAVAFLIFVPTLCVFGIIDPSDGLYAECSREMLEKGEFITPSFDYIPFYEKPIWIYWCIMACYKLFGVHEWAARLPSALSAITLVAGTYALCRQFINRRAAVLASAVLLGSPLFCAVGHLALTDMLFTLYLSVGTLCLFSKLLGGSLSLLFFGYACLGLGVLTKGPTTLALCGGTLFIYLLCRGLPAGSKWYQLWWQYLFSLHPLAGLAIICLINGPWYVTETMRTHGAFFQEFIIRQHLGRAAGTVNHQQAWYYYVPILLGGFFPWWMFLGGSFGTLQRLWQKRSSKSNRAALAVLCMAWSILVILLFSSVKAKLPTYVLPALPPLAILCGIGMDASIKAGKTKILTAICALTGILALAAGLAAVILSHRLGANATNLLCLVTGLLLLGAGGLYAALAKNAALRTRLLSFAMATMASAAVLVPTGLHLQDKQLHRPFRKILRQALGQSGSLATFMRDSPAALFYAGKEVPLLIDENDYAAFEKKGPQPHMILTTKDVVPMAVQRCKGIVEVTRQDKWILYRAP